MEDRLNVLKKKCRKICARESVIKATGRRDQVTMSELAHTLAKKAMVQGQIQRINETTTVTKP